MGKFVNIRRMLRSEYEITDWSIGFRGGVGGYRRGAAVATGLGIKNICDTFFIPSYR